jgi:hypothetical protein
MKPIINDGGDTLTSFFWKGKKLNGKNKTGYKIYEIKDKRQQGNKFILTDLNTFILKLLIYL